MPEIFGSDQVRLNRRELAWKMEEQTGNQPLNTGVLVCASNPNTQKAGAEESLFWASQYYISLLKTLEEVFRILHWSLRGLETLPIPGF